MNVQPAMSKAEHDDAILGDLLSVLGGDDDQSDEIVLESLEDELVLDASADTLSAEVVTPAASVEPAAPAAPAAAAEKPKSKGKTAAPKEKKAKAEKPEAKEPVKRQYFADKVDRLKHRVAEDFDTVMKEANVTEAQLREAGVKVKNRVSFLVEFATGKTERLNSVMQTAITVLNRDKNLITGEKGNFIQELVKNGLKPSSARAMAGNAVAAMRLLNMIEQSGAQTYVAAKDSNILKSINARLGA